MKKLSSAIAILLTIVILAPSVFLLAPQPVYAQGVPTAEMPYTPLTLKTVISAIQNTITAIAAPVSAAANVAMQVNAYVLQPLAFVLSGNLLKSITSSVISFVIGKANATGIPQFVVDVRRSMQTVADSQALAFFTQYGKNSNSPFALSISSSLRLNYLQSTSLAGFWAANMSTLERSSPNVNRFLAGNWSQGGAAAWFALTTQDQNNPYTLYLRSQGLNVSTVQSAQAARTLELNWGSGMMSWCGEGTPTNLAKRTGSASSTAMGINPGDPCTNADGTSGTIKTPGSVISASLNKALGTDQDQLVRLGNVGPEINNILGNIAKVVQTVQFATQLLGGSGSGGLLGVGQTSASNPTRPLDLYANSTGNMGVSTSSVIQNQGGILSNTDSMNNKIAGSVAGDTIDRITQYQSAWNTISIATNAASTSVTTLANYCTGQTSAAQDLIDETYVNNSRVKTILTQFINTTSNVQVTTAHAVLANVISPVLAQITAANTIITAANELLNMSTSTAAIDTSQTMSPTVTEVGNAQREAQFSGTAKANPAGSLNVSANSIVDKLNLIGTNAVALKNTCDFQPLLDDYFDSLYND
ncbi:MAG: hypothetical protein Q8O94_01335 [bacterium]|nr:hypothetical protein [bacterium]